jgi:hypothetical protein
MNEKSVSLTSVPQPPLVYDNKCPVCGEFDVRRTHESMHYEDVRFRLCRCLVCWTVLWIADVDYLQVFR